MSRKKSFWLWVGGIALVIIGAVEYALTNRPWRKNDGDALINRAKELDRQAREEMKKNVEDISNLSDHDLVADIKKRIRPVR